MRTTSIMLSNGTWHKFGCCWLDERAVRSVGCCGYHIISIERMWIIQQKHKFTIRNWFSHQMESSVGETVWLLGYTSDDLSHHKHHKAHEYTGIQRRFWAFFFLNIYHRARWPRQCREQYKFISGMVMVVTINVITMLIAVAMHRWIISIAHIVYARNKWDFELEPIQRADWLSFSVSGFIGIWFAYRDRFLPFLHHGHRAEQICWIQIVNGYIYRHRHDSMQCKYVLVSSFLISLSLPLSLPLYLFLILIQRKTKHLRFVRCRRRFSHSGTLLQCGMSHEWHSVHTNLTSSISLAFSLSRSLAHSRSPPLFFYLYFMARCRAFSLAHGVSIRKLLPFYSTQVVRCVMNLCPWMCVRPYVCSPAWVCVCEQRSVVDVE